MPVEAPYPGLSEIMELMGEAGRRISEIDASEGAAGNISVYIGWPLDPRRKFPIESNLELPTALPELAGALFLVTGSGRRLREIQDDPAGNLGALVIEQDGKAAKLYTSPTCLFAKLTSELNSHLAVHYDQITRTGTNFHAVIHAQPPHLTYLSQIPRYQDEQYLNRHLLHWQPELIINLPEGIGNIPFCIPGSAELMAHTLEKLRNHRVVLWGKHGAMARSDMSVKRASDRIEYAETAAKYEYMNLVNGEQAEGLSDEQMRAICAAFHIEQSIY
ncbi:MAG: class II aldolase/adducin family protein [Chloroflexi bacterium]|nr:class II aldolase/adducin family protein [Chloroflexota bacterium]